MKRFLIPMFAALFIVLYCNPASAIDKKAQGPRSGTSRAEHGGFNFGAWVMSLYRANISAVDGDRCPSIPSCSSYSVQAFKKHGFIMGWFMTVDRLIHEGSDEEKVSPVIYSNGKWKIYDPLKNNDFWWYHEHKKRDE